MRRVIDLLLFVVCAVAATVATAQDVSAPPKMVWVQIQFNLEEDEEIETHYFMAQIKRSIYSRIAQRKIDHGFLHLTSLRYWNQDNIVEDNHDGLYSNEMVIRIEGIQKMSLLIREPKIGESWDVIEQEAKAKKFERTGLPAADPEKESTPL